MALINKTQLGEHRPKMTAAEMELVFNTHILEALSHGRTEVAVSIRRLAFETDAAMDMLRAAGYNPQRSSSMYDIAPEGPTIRFSLE